MHKILAVALGVALVCAATSASAQPSSPAQRLQAVAAQARLQLIDQRPDVLDALAGQSGALPTDGLTAPGRLVFAEFIGGSVQYVSTSRDRAVTAWFNPLADAWVVGLWTAEGDAWRLTAIGAASSQDLSPIAGETWNRRAPTLAGALAAQGRRGHEIFRDVIAPGRADERLRDRRASATALRQVLADTADRARRLGALQRVQGYGRFLDVIDDSLVAHTEAVAGDPRIQARILALPSDVRLTLRPAMAFSRRDGETLAVQSPAAPSLIFIIHLVSTSTPRPRAVRIETVDLFEGDA